MAYHDREYTAFLLLGNPTTEPLWTRERWLEVYRTLDPVVKGCRDKPSVRVSQSLKGAKREDLKFGRLAWSPASFEKWVHGSLGLESASADWEFFFAEVSAPSIAVAAREGQPPDFFLTLTNEAFIGNNTHLAFNPRVFIAIATDLPVEVQAACRSAILKIEKLVCSQLSAKIRRPWGFSFGSFGGFQQAIQDIAHIGLFKVGPVHSRPVTLATLVEAWEPLQ